MPIKCTSPERVKLTIQHHRLKCKQLESRIEEMQTALEKCNENVTPELNNDLITTLASKSKSNLKPYHSVEDSRFEWLDTFLSYFSL